MKVENTMDQNAESEKRKIELEAHLYRTQNQIIKRSEALVNILKHSEYTHKAESHLKLVSEVTEKLLEIVKEL